MNLANSLSLFRIFLVPIFTTVLLTRVEHHLSWGLGLFILASITDFVDGFVARKLKQITQLGKLLDPLADKLLITSAFIALVELELAPAWIVVLIVGREFAVTGLRTIAMERQILIAASWLGKWKTFIQIFAVVALLLQGPVKSLYPQFLKSLHWIGQISLWLAVAMALISAIHYFSAFFKKVSLDELQKNQ